MPPSKKGMDISLVIPVYNGAPFIESTTHAYVNAFEKSPLIHAYEIILVTNNCSDNSPALGAGLAKKNPKIKHIDFPYKILKGGAVIRGFQHARYDNVGFADVDNATPPAEFLKLISPLREENVGASIGSRKMPDSVLHPPQPLSRRVLGAGFSIIRELLFGLGVRDSQCGAKIFKKKSIEPLALKNNGFAFDVELLYRVKKNGFLIREVGVVWEDKPSVVFLADPWLPLSMLWQIIKTRLNV